ncbi:MAG: DUF4136 domain-containing protein [Bacteroidales bacterium]
MSKLIHLILVLFLSGFLLSCSSVKITADYDKTVDFSQYKTFEYYGWAPETDTRLNELDKKRIEDAFANEFYKRGLSYVQSGGDLVVTLILVIQDKTQTTTHTDYGPRPGYYGGYYGYGPGWGWGAGYSRSYTTSYDYKVGTLVCDVFDKKKEQLIWEGIASKTLDDNTKDREERIARIVAAMMNKYPLQPKEE